MANLAVSADVATMMLQENVQIQRVTGIDAIGKTQKLARIIIF